MIRHRATYLERIGDPAGARALLEQARARELVPAPVSRPR
jgi:hypothetical protein